LLTKQQLHHFIQHGYLVFDSLFSSQQMSALKSEALRIVDAFDPESTRSVFSTKNQDTARDDYFLQSGDKVRCFFEEDAFDENGELQQAKALSINKIGHALHQLSPTFNAFSHLPEIAKIASSLGCLQPEIRQSMYIFKQPKIGGEIRWHQDATYFYTQPQSVLTFWLAIEDANIQNGCLQVAQDNANFPLKEQFVRDQDDKTELLSLHNKSWPLESTALEVNKGTLVVFSGLLPHFSDANTSTKSRHAFTLHITSGNSQYDAQNWLQNSPSKLNPD
jgi:phytanoyl-CoA hydroxylase